MRDEDADAAARTLPLRHSDDIQGDILAGFRKDRQTVLLLRFPDDPGPIPKWLRQLIPQISTTRQVAAFNSASELRVAAARAGFVAGHSKLTGDAPPLPEWTRNGSFQVVRRLARDVPALVGAGRCRAQAARQGGGRTASRHRHRVAGRPGGRQLAFGCAGGAQPRTPNHRPNRARRSTT